MEFKTHDITCVITLLCILLTNLSHSFVLLTKTSKFDQLKTESVPVNTVHVSSGKDNNGKNAENTIQRISEVRTRMKANDETIKLKNKYESENEGFESLYLDLQSTVRGGDSSGVGKDMAEGFISKSGTKSVYSGGHKEENEIWKHHVKSNTSKEHLRTKRAVSDEYGYPRGYTYPAAYPTPMASLTASGYPISSYAGYSPIASSRLASYNPYLHLMNPSGIGYPSVPGTTSGIGPFSDYHTRHLSASPYDGKQLASSSPHVAYPYDTLSQSSAAYSQQQPAKPSDLSPGFIPGIHYNPMMMMAASPYTDQAAMQKAMMLGYNPAAVSQLPFLPPPSSPFLSHYMDLMARMGRKKKKQPKVIHLTDCHDDHDDHCDDHSDQHVISFDKHEDDYHDPHDDDHLGLYNDHDDHDYPHVDFHGDYHNDDGHYSYDEHDPHEDYHEDEHDPHDYHMMDDYHDDDHDDDHGGGRGYGKSKKHYYRPKIIIIKKIISQSTTTLPPPPP